MTIENLLKKRNMTKYRLAVDAGIPHATLNDICSGKTLAELERRLICTINPCIAENRHIWSPPLWI